MDDLKLTAAETAAVKVYDTDGSVLGTAMRHWDHVRPGTILNMLTVDGRIFRIEVVTMDSTIIQPSMRWDPRHREGTCKEI